MLGVVSTGVRHIVEDFLWVEIVPLGNRNQPLWSESAFSVNVHSHASATTLLDRHLSSHTQRVAQLSLAGSKLSEYFRDGARLEPPLQ